MFAWYYKLRGKPVPYYAHYPLWLILWKPLRKFINVVIIPNTPFSNLRVMLYRLLGFKIGKNVFIGMKCYLDDMDPSLTSIGDGVVISYCVKFAVHGKWQNHTPIIIGNNVFVGMGSLLLSGKSGITIGQNAIIGAGSVVTKSLPANAVVAGAPAKVLRIVELSGNGQSLILED